MGFIEQMKGHRYRARVFDHGIFLLSVEVPNRGQRYITVTVKKKALGIFGDESKIALMINPKIQPKIFGMVHEIDFDIRDATQLADLLDLAPDLVFEINEKYVEIDRILKEEKLLKERAITVDIKPIPDPEINRALFEEEKAAPENNTSASSGIPQPLPAQGPVEPSAAPVEIKEVVKKKLDRAAENTRNLKQGVTEGLKLIKTLKELKALPENAERKKLISDCLDLCAKHPKYLYWLPEYLEIDKEIHAIVSQSVIRRVGIIPSYYQKQTAAEISEKMLSKPAPKGEWQQVVLIGIIIMGIVGTIGLFVWLLKG
jgi:hypothetical protein